MRFSSAEFGIYKKKNNEKTAGKDGLEQNVYDSTVWNLGNQCQEMQSLRQHSKWIETVQIKQPLED